MYRPLLAGLLLTLIVSTVSAQPTVPPLISFSGLLTDGAGAPVSETSSVVFRLYDDQSTFTHLWTETQEVEIVDGVFSIQLGSVMPIPDSVFAGIDVYLDIKVGTDDEMAPRHRLTSSGWSFRSGCVVTVWYADTDEAGFGDPATETLSCTAQVDFIDTGYDCDETAADSLRTVDTSCSKVVAEACSKRYALVWGSTSASVARMKSGRFQLLGVAGQTAVGESTSKRYRLQAGVLYETIRTVKRIKARLPA